MRPILPPARTVTQVSQIQVAKLFKRCSSFPVVPVYDGRARSGKPAFAFSDADFNKLSTWHLYKKGTCEIPVDSIVSVGYTLGTYKGTAGPVLSSNIQFVIVLATPL